MSATCCPPGLVYIDGSGNYNDPSPYIGSGHVSNSANPGVLNSCSGLTNIGGGVAYAMPSGNSPIDCLCCPSGYTYSSFSGKCIGSSPLDPAVLPVPCIVCVCPPPVVNTCPTCGTSGEAIVFQFDFETKQCGNCTPQENNGPSCIASFIPEQYVDPIINFKLRNKNFI